MTCIHPWHLLLTFRLVCIYNQVTYGSFMYWFLLDHRTNADTNLITLVWQLTAAGQLTSHGVKPALHHRTRLFWFRDFHWFTQICNTCLFFYLVIVAPKKCSKPNYKIKHFCQVEIELNKLTSGGYCPCFHCNANTFFGVKCLSECMHLQMRTSYFQSVWLRLNVKDIQLQDSRNFRCMKLAWASSSFVSRDGFPERWRNIKY